MFDRRAGMYPNDTAVAQAVGRESGEAGRDYRVPKLAGADSAAQSAHHSDY
jgi:hypothetical protein